MRGDQDFQAALQSHIRTIEMMMCVTLLATVDHSTVDVFHEYVMSSYIRNDLNCAESDRRIMSHESTHQSGHWWK